jgi:4-amino-4-deoxy-L-arabinose transferase-like glycosyltransferase
MAQMTRAERGITGEATAIRWVLALIAVVTVARLLLAASLGLGVDEAYTVATARTLALGTFDHPPLAWWLAGGAARLFETEAALWVRLPFIALGALSLWLAFDAGRTLYTPRAGVFAAIVIALAPVLGWTAGSMVLPDAPLFVGLLVGLGCLARALFGDPASAPRWWLLAGAAAGIACLSKLHGIFLLAGTGLFLLTTPTHRFWLTRPWPYLAALVTLAVASPFLIWNAQHDWVSFAFQASRAKANRIDLAGPLVALGGQALFVLPWVWLALVISLAKAVRLGPARSRDWLLFCCAIGPIAVFTIIAVTGTKTLFHWAAPGYIFAAVLLGRDIAADLDAGVTRTRTWLKGSAVAITVILGAALALARMPWPMTGPLNTAAWTLPNGKPIPYPLIETKSWAELKPALAARGLLREPKTFVAGIRWHEAGRLAVALGPEVAVRCLCGDPRGFGILTDNRLHLGADAIIVTADGSEADIRASLAPYFATLEPIAPVTITQGGAPVQTLQLFRGTNFRDPGPRTPDLLRPFALKR